MRTLPIAVAKKKKLEQDDKVEQFRQEVQQYEQALASPGPLPAALAGQGIEAREFSIKSMARSGDQPATSNRKSLSLVAFIVLMAGAVGLAYLYDRSLA